jgi:hypothetical protein
MAQTLEDLSESMEIAYKTDLTFHKTPEGIFTRARISVYLENKSNHPVNKPELIFAPSGNTQNMRWGDPDDDAFYWYVDTYQKGIVVLGKISIEYTDIYGKSHTQSEAIKAFIKHPTF